MSGISLGIRPVNERCRYIVTTSLIGWGHTQTDPCMLIDFICVLGMRYETDCKPCLGGYYCESLGAINFDFSLNDTGTGQCEAGYYCKSGILQNMSMVLLCSVWFCFLVDSCNKFIHIFQD